MPVYERATLLVPSGTFHAPDKKHLHIVCCEPNDSGDVVLVSIASYTNDLCDQTCILEPHDHGFIRHRSYVLYRKADIFSAQALTTGVEDGSIIVRDDLNAQVFLRVRNGICASPQTKRKVKRFMGC